MKKRKVPLDHKQPTPKEKTILSHLLYYRFLTTNHLQQLLTHKQPQRTQAWLQKLTQDGYVIQDYDRHRMRENTKPAVYCLTAKAGKILKDNTNCDPVILKRLYREKRLSKKFQAHCLTMADFSLHLRRLYQDSNDTLHYFTPIALTDYSHFPKPLPDAYIAIKGKGKKPRRFFVELFDEGTPRFAIRSKIQRYFTCAEEGEWGESQPFPEILVICPTTFMQKYIERFTQSLLEESYEELSFNVKTKEQALTQVLTNS